MNRRDFLVSSLGLVTFSGRSQADGSARQTALVLDKRFNEHIISPAHPESPARYQAFERALTEQDWLERLHILKPWGLEQTEPWLHTIHSEKHIASIRQNDAETYAHAALATGACLAAVEFVLSGTERNAFCPSRPPGHHALNTGQEEGFCYFNHVAIAARYAQQKHALENILIIDWDYHHGNGTEWAFYDDPTVLFFSTHDQFAYPGTGSPLRQGSGEGHGFNINVHLDCGSSDSDVMRAFESQLLPVLERFNPDLILISSGFDSREDDLLGCFSISDAGFARLTQWVMALADEVCQGRVVSLLEGGYNIKGNASAAIAHLKTLAGMSYS
jgi:acetoin utilization deacetylase AcuC-like enzyme